jgi:protein SCO1
MNSLPTKRLGAGWAVVLALLGLASGPLAAAPAPASSLSDEALLRIRFDQNINAQVALDLCFRDETGRRVKLGDYLGDRPAVLVLGYYGCPMLCTLVLNGMVECFQDLKMEVGDQFQVINVSINPREEPALAAAKKRTYLRRYGRARAEAGWHFLTGEEEAIHKLADEVGFHYVYDPANQQYAHPSGLIVLTPHGRVARYFFGVNFSSKELSAALREAGAEKTGSVVDQLFLLCFHYSPLRGRYGHLAMTVLRLAALATVVAILGLVFRARQRPRPAHAGELDLASATAPALVAAGTEQAKGDRP